VSEPATRSGRAPRLGAQGARFTLDGQLAFLLGASYYAGQGAPDAILQRDLDLLQEHGFDWIRVWTTWAAFGHDVSSVDTDGYPRPPYLERLERLVRECGQRRLIVDVTFSRGNGATGPPRLQGLEPHRRAVRVVVERLKDEPNWYLDLANERNVPGSRYVGHEELRDLRQLVRELDPRRLVTASCAGGDLTADEVRRSVQDVGLDFLAPHRPRDPDSPAQTGGRTREALGWLHDLGRVVPVHYQEPFRRGYGKWPPPASAFVEDLLGAFDGGAAGWCFHTGHQGGDPAGRPRRSFDLREQGLFDQLDEVEREVVQEVRRLAPRLRPG
jgi:hypothetical protein